MTTTARGPAEVELLIGGMTCASCAARVEKKLNRMDGVTATVNYATEKARVSFPDGVTTDDLIATVEKTGYTAALPQPVRAEEPAAADPARSLRTRLLVSTALTLPVVAMAMVPALQFDFWQWLSLTLAAPVVVWGGAPFHRAAWTNLRHGAATMDTLVSLGTLAAFGWSLYALFLGTAGEPGMTHPFELTIARTDGSANIYLEAAAGVTTFILAGPVLRGPLQAAGRRRAAGAAGARRQAGVGPPRRGGAARPGRRPDRGRAVRRPPRREDRRGRRGHRRVVGRRRLHAHRGVRTGGGAAG